MQYELMRYIAAAHGCVTVVGDPDQSSMFAFLSLDQLSHSCGQYTAGVRRKSKICQRCVNVTTFKIPRFHRCLRSVDFPTTEQIFLEQNYRSTGSILSASLAIVAQGPPVLSLPPQTMYADDSFPNR